MPVILATQEAEIWMIVPAQANSSQDMVSMCEALGSILLSKINFVEV
jgi:hypothetical protein